jgi:internalin A
MSQLNVVPGRPRRRFRLSLRAVLVVVLVIGGWLGWIVYKARAQREAVQAIEGGNGQVIFHWQLANGTVIPKAKPPQFGGLRELLGREYFERPVRVVLFARSGGRNGPVVDGDAVMTHVGRLEALEELTVNSENISEKGLSHLANLTRLRKLTIAPTGRYTPTVPNGRDARGGPNLDRKLAGLAGMSRLVELDLSQFPVSDEGLVYLRGLSSLRRLVLSRTTTDAALVHLKDLTGLRVLDLEAAPITVIGLRHLSRLVGLVELNLNLTDVNSLEPLRELTTLRKLGLMGCPLGDAGLAAIENFGELRELELFQTGITDAGMVHLRGLTKLTSLGLRANVRVTDHGVASLSKMTFLSKLDLERTKVSDSGLESLSRLTGLREVRVWGTRVSDSGIEKIRDAHPILGVAR